MILDLTAKFSSAQAITATAVSTNVIDLGVSRDVGRGVSLPLLVQVDSDFNTLTSLKVSVQTDVAENFGSVTTLTEQTVLLADLVAGKQFDFQIVPTSIQRYVRLNYTVVGTDPTTGSISAGIVTALKQS